MADPALRPVASFATLGLLLATGHLVRSKLRCLRVVFLPASCIGGALGCVFLQLSHLHPPVYRFVHEELAAGWLELPSLLTNIVFVTLVLGSPLPSLGELWRISGPQLAFAQILAFGQYATCGLLSALLLGPIFKARAL